MSSVKRNRGIKLSAGILLGLLLVGVAIAQDKPASNFVIRFSNGDLLHVKPVSLQNGELTFVPDVAPKGPVTVPASAIDSIYCDRCPADTTKTEDTLQLHDGSVLKGTFVRITKGDIAFRVAGLGEVAVPRAAADSLLRTGAESSPPRTVADSHVVSTQAGDILIGNLLPGADGTIVVEGKDLRATINYASVKGVYFPAPKMEEPKGTDTKQAKGSKEPKKEPTAETTRREKELRMTVTLRNGTKLFGRSPTLSSGELSIVIAGDHRVKLSSDALQEMAFVGTGTQIGFKRVLLWGKHADRYQEFKRTVEALQSGLAGWTLDEDFSDTFTPEFRKKLMQSRALVIPEMERWQSPRFRTDGGPKPADLAAALRSMTGPFLRAGGNVVILCPSRYQTDFLRDAGLLDVNATRSLDNVEVNFTPEGAAIARGIGRSFRSTNATQFYTVGTKLPASAWALHQTDSPVIGRKVGGGWVILLGMDFFARNDQTTKLLLNAVTLP